METDRNLQNTYCSQHREAALPRISRVQRKEIAQLEKDNCRSIYISNRVFENRTNEMCSHLREKTFKGRFLKPENLQNHSNEGEERKAMIAL